MAYQPGNEVQYYSNPDVRYNGTPTGTATDNNARVLRETMAQVENYREALEAPEISVLPITRSVAASGGNGTFTVSSNTSWIWSDSAAWLTSNEPTSQSGNQTFFYSAAANTSAQSRTATITITVGNRHIRAHTVTQAGAEVFRVVEANSDGRILFLDDS